MKSTSPKKKSTGSAKKGIQVKDLPPKKDPRGGATDHNPKGQGNKSDY